MVDKIVDTQIKAKKLRGMIYVLSQALEFEVNGSIYVDCLDGMEDIADEVYKNLTEICLESCQKKK